MDRLTEVEAWLYVAELWDQATAADCPEGWHQPRGIGDGLCLATGDLINDGLVSHATADRMDERVLELLNPVDGDDRASPGYWWKHDQVGCRERVIACCLLAAMAERRAEEEK